MPINIINVQNRAWPLLLVDNDGIIHISRQNGIDPEKGRVMLTDCDQALWQFHCLGNKQAEEIISLSSVFCPKCGLSKVQFIEVLIAGQAQFAGYVATRHPGFLNNGFLPAIRNNELASGR